MVNYTFNLAILLLVFVHIYAEECDVCVKILSKIEERVQEKQKISKEQKSKEVYMDSIKKICETLDETIDQSIRKKDNSFCYIIGAVEGAPTSMVIDVTNQMLIVGKQPLKKCQELNRKNSQICEIKYDKPVDWDNLDLPKMRIKQLKELMSKLGDSCKGCVEKTDYIERINELKPKSKAEL